jgi:GNAT superfamily N-acetyltransferase
MDSNQVQTFPIQILKTPSHIQIQKAAEWLANHQPQNPDLEIALHVILQSRIIPHERGGLVAIAHTAPTASDWTQSDIQGIVIAKPGNVHVSIASANRAATEALFSLILARGCPQRLCTSEQTKSWIRPLLLQHYQLQREYDQQVLICTQAPDGAAGRWAVPQDKPALQAYAAAYLAERGSGSLEHPWDDWIQQRRIAVLEDNGQIVAVVRRSQTVRHAIVVAPFTFPQFRRQGFARRLLAFFTQELLQEFPAVKLWVNADNAPAIALYHALNFQKIGGCYTSYFIKKH